MTPSYDIKYLITLSLGVSNLIDKHDAEWNYLIVGIILIR